MSGELRGKRGVDDLRARRSVTRASARHAFGLAALVALVPACFARSACSRHAAPRPSVRTLVLHDDGAAGELYATGAGVVASHFGEWRAEPLSAYRRGQMREYDATVYVASAPVTELAPAFVDDVLAGTSSVVWAGGNANASAARFSDRFGFTVGPAETGPFGAGVYKGVTLARRSPVGLERVDVLHADRAVTLATAHRADGTGTAWAVRSGRLTYIAENPLAWVTDGDRYLAFCDLLFDALAPEAPERHRALVRIEDVSARSDPASLRAIADALAAREVPFSIALIPVFVDPGAGVRVPLRDAPHVVDALRYMLERGGSLVLHGFTHQRTGVSGADYEFYRARTEAGHNDVLEGPVPGDSEAWAEGRVRGALDEVAAAGLPRPSIFELPHYAGSRADSVAIARILPFAFQRATFYARGDEDPRTALSLPFPFVVDDIYGFRLIPENLGYHVAAPALGERVVDRAQKLRVVRDGVAGFFYHPSFGAEPLATVVDAMKRDGWAFVSAASVVHDAPVRSCPAWLAPC